MFFFFYAFNTELAIGWTLSGSPEYGPHIIFNMSCVIDVYQTPQLKGGHPLKEPGLSAAFLMDSADLLRFGQAKPKDSCHKLWVTPKSPLCVKLASVRPYIFILTVSAYIDVNVELPASCLLCHMHKQKFLLYQQQ